MEAASGQQGGPDRLLVETAAKALRHYALYQKLSRETEAAAGGPCDMPPHVEKHAKAAARLFLATRRRQATSLRGLAAKASIFAALDDPGASGPEYPMGTEGIARSICRDLAPMAERETGGLTEAILIYAWRSLPEDRQADLLRMVLDYAHRSRAN